MNFEAGISSELAMVLRLCGAAIAGYIIGLERRWHGHPAGDRTFALTSLGAALFALISLRAFPVGDARVAAGVVTGLGFLGAGMILRGQGTQVRGLTTAAGIWTAGAIGLAIGSGLWLLGITGTVLALFLLASEALFRIDRRIEAARERREREKEKLEQPEEAKSE